LTSDTVIRLLERFKNCLLFVFRNSSACVFDINNQFGLLVCLINSGSQMNFALVGKFDCIADQINE